MKPTNETLKAYGIKEYDIYEDSVYVTLPCKDPSLAIGEYIRAVEKGMMLNLKVPMLGCYPIFLFHADMIQVLQHALGMDGMDDKFLDLQIAVQDFVKEVTKKGKVLDTWDGAYKKEEAIAPVKRTITLTSKPAVTPDSNDYADHESAYIEATLGELFDKPVSPVTKACADFIPSPYTAREYEADITHVVEVVIYYSKPLSITNILQRMNERGYDSQKYGEKPYHSIQEINKMLVLKGMIAFVDKEKYGIEQCATDKGVLHGFGSFTTQHGKGKRFYNMNSKGIRSFAELMLEEGFAVQNGVHYKLVVLSSEDIPLLK